jgi:hypothetical protein
VVPELTGIDTARARALVADFLSGQRLGGWLPDPAGLLSCYGLAPLEADGGLPVLIEVTSEPVFGPVVAFSLRSDVSELLGDRIARLAPLTDVDADELIRGLRAAPLLLGHGGAAPVDLGALAQALHRVSRLADDLDEIAELELPLLATPGGARPGPGRIRLVPTEPADPFLRRLR